MSPKFPKEIPKDQVPIYNRTLKRMVSFSELAAPEAFRWLGWSVAIAAVQLAAIKTSSWKLDLIPWLLFLLLILRIQWAWGMTPKHEDESKPIAVKVNGWSVLLACFSWIVAYQIAFTLPAEIVKSDLLPTKEELVAAAIDRNIEGAPKKSRPEVQVTPPGKEGKN